MTPLTAMRRWFGSVRVRITLTAAGLVAVALAAASFGLVWFVHNNLVSEIKRTNREQVDAVARQIEAGRTPGEVSFPSEAQMGGIQSFLVVGPDGRLYDFVSHQFFNGRWAGVPPLGGDAVRDQQTVATQQGQITLIADRSLADVNQTIHSVDAALWIGVPALVLAVALLAWYLAGRALRPVEAIRAEAAAITGSTMHRRVPEPAGDDEVGRLARTMNAMLDRLEQSSVRQRQFVSDASHELRSPVAAIRAQLEVALRRGDQTSWPPVARRVLDEDHRLEAAVGELLELARIEESTTERPASVDVDVDDLVFEEVSRVRAVPIDTSKVSAGRVQGDAAQLARLVRNLLDNASSHARSRVNASVVTDDGWVVLTVDDDGPGILPEDRERVFDRFTRLDEGRDRGGGGAGLGLAMVRAIAQRHGGEVTVDDAPIGGARLVVRLPAEGPRP